MAGVGSCCLLELPDGRLVFQRRSDAKASPFLLDFYGGHQEPGESHLQTVKRELAEETSIDVNHLHIEYIGQYTYKPMNSTAYFYKAKIKSPHFKTYEGLWEEAYTLKEALARDDLTPDTIALLEHYKGEVK